MIVPTRHHIIEKDGKPAFAVLPYDEYLELLGAKPDEEVLLPHEVVKKVGLEDKSLVRAWREHLGLTQAEVARRMSVTQAALAQMEKRDAHLRLTTLKKIAAALDVEWEQLRHQ